MRAVLVVSLLLACSPKPDGEEGTAGSSSSSSSSAGAPTTSEGPTTDDPTGEACVDPAQTEFGPAVAITIRNDGAEPLFIRIQSFCDDILPVTLLADDVKIQISPGRCDFPCGAALTGQCECPLGCADLTDIVQIFPGGVYTDTWSGVRVVPFELDAACFTEGCGEMCTAQLQTPPGSYTVRASASAAVNNCETCDCTANAEGWCVFEADLSGAQVVAETMLEYPTQTAVILSFE